MPSAVLARGCGCGRLSWRQSAQPTAQVSQGPSWRVCGCCQVSSRETSPGRSPVSTLDRAQGDALTETRSRRWLMRKNATERSPDIAPMVVPLLSRCGPTIGRLCGARTAPHRRPAQRHTPQRLSARASTPQCLNSLTPQRQPLASISLTACLFLAPSCSADTPSARNGPKRLRIGLLPVPRRGYSLLASA